MTRTKRKQSNAAPWAVSAIIVLGFVFVCLCFAGSTILERIGTQATQTPAAEVDPRDATLTLAYSPEKAALVRDLVELPYSTGGLLERLEVRERARDQLGRYGGPASG